MMRPALALCLASALVTGASVPVSAEPASTPVVQVFVPASDESVTITISSSTPGTTTINIVSGGRGVPGPLPYNDLAEPPAQQISDSDTTSAATPSISESRSGSVEEDQDQVVPDEAVTVAVPTTATTTTSSPFSSSPAPASTATVTKPAAAPTGTMTVPVVEPVEPTAATAAKTVEETETPTATGMSLPSPSTTPATGTPTSAAATDRPAPATPPAPASGLPWKHGTFGHDPERTTKFEAATGHKVDIISVFTARGSWEKTLDPWWLNTAPAGFTGVLDVAVPLWQDDGSVDQAAAGAYNDKWRQLGEMIHAKYPGSAVRIGWEMNLKGWTHGANPGNVEQWKEAFRQASTSLKAGGPSLLVEFVPNAGKSDGLADAMLAYPGDDYVDIIGVDSYDWWPALTEANESTRLARQQDIDTYFAEAIRRNKLFSLPEWGVAPANAAAGGDNPVYIDAVMENLRAKEAEHPGSIFSVIYFDEPDSHMKNSMATGQVPRAAAAYKKQLAAALSGAAPAPAAAGPAAPSTTPTSAETTAGAGWTQSGPGTTSN